MKKKIFIQLHPIFILLLNGFLLLCIVGGIIIFIRYPLLEGLPKVRTGIKKNIVLILYPIVLIYISWVFITYNHHWITFREKYIYVPSDWRIKRNRQQHRLQVSYDNIIDVFFIRSTKSSKDKTIQIEALHPFYHQYMVLCLKNGKKERIMIDYYTKKQKVRILEELKTRLEYCGNNIDLTNAQESLQKLGMVGEKFFIDIAEKNNKKELGSQKKINK